MKNYLIIIATLFLMASCGSKKGGEVQPETSDIINNKSLVTNTEVASVLATEPGDVILLSRYDIGNYESATYSFMFLTRDDTEKTHNNWELLFEARIGNGDDSFMVNMVVDDNSYIYDLGERSCKDIKSNATDDRLSRPLVWLAYSDADPSGLNPERSLSVHKGHCYLTYNNDENGRVVALFHVKNHIKGGLVVLNEIEVLDRLKK
jgi:hypothetical protein